jgi:hypothetical protein
MANTTYIIRFAEESARDKFFETLQTQANTKDKQIEFGEFLPDLIIHDVSEEELQEINALAGTEVRFFADFKQDLMRG